MKTIADIENLYAALGAGDHEAVMAQLADDCVWVVADNSPLADKSPYNGVDAIRSGVFERLGAGFEKLDVEVDEIFECDGDRVVVLGYYDAKFRGAPEGFRAQVAHVWNLRDGRAVKFQQYLDTQAVARAAGQA